MTFSALYVYGHLPAIAFSLSMALACAAVALRIPEARKDLALSAVYLLTSATTALELWLARRPSLAAGRAYLPLTGGAQPPGPARGDIARGFPSGGPPRK